MSNIVHLKVLLNVKLLVLLGSFAYLMFFLCLRMVCNKKKIGDNIKFDIFSSCIYFACNLFSYLDEFI